MNKRELIKKRRENWYKYKISHGNNLQRIKMNVIYISTANSLDHEIGKLKICYELRKQGHYFITEAEDIRTKERADVVDLDTGIRYEIETDPRRAKRFEGRKNIEVIKLWEKKE